MRIGIFGGTFDPVHLGHLILAEQCREQAGLDQVLFIPAARPPHKLERILTPFHHRAEMLELAVAGNPAFRVDRLEEDRTGPSYTIHTLEILKTREADAEICLIMGSDTLVDLQLWYQPVRILELASLAVVVRAGSQAPSAESLRAGLSLPATFDLRMQIVRMPLLDISSSSIRARIPLGKSVRYEVPRSVEMYAKEKKLYLPGSENEKASEG